MCRSQHYYKDQKTQGKWRVSKYVDAHRASIIYFFTDDSLILMKARISDAQQLAHILEVYERASRQVINMDKSYIMFSPNTNQSVRTEMKACLSMIMKLKGKITWVCLCLWGKQEKGPLSIL